MAAFLTPNAKQQFFDNAGNPAAGFKLYTYAAGTASSVPQATFTDRNESVPNSNPIILDARGEAIIYLPPGQVYDYELRTASEVPVWTREGITTTAGDASGMGFQQSGTSAALRTVEEKLRDTLSVMDFVDSTTASGVLAGAVSASAAIGAAWDAALARGRAGIDLPAGRFLIDASIARTITGSSGFSIRGAGMGITQLIVTDPTGNGLDITCASGGNWWLNVDPSNAITISNLSICASGNNLGVGIKINGRSAVGRPAAPIVLDHVEIRAKDSINGQAFLTGLRLLDCSNVHLNHCLFRVGGNTNQVPVAVKIEATGATTHPVSINFSHCAWTYGGVAVEAGNYVEGIYFTNCEVVASKNAVKWLTSTGESGLHWVGGHVNVTEHAFLLGNMFDVVISGGLFFGSSSSGFDVIQLDAGGRVNITGNVIHSRGASLSAGVRIKNSSSASQYVNNISANTFTSASTAIVLEAGANNVHVGENAYRGCTANVSNAGTTNYVRRRSWSETIVKTLTGGAAFENVDFAIPAGVYTDKPEFGDVTLQSNAGQDITGYYLWGDAATTATNARFRLVKRDGTNLSAGAHRFGFHASGLP